VTKNLKKESNNDGPENK